MSALLSGVVPSTDTLSVSTGMVGPLGFNLGLLDSSLVFIFFGFFTALAAPGLSLFGTKLGLRQMVLARYSFGCVPHSPYALPSH